MAEASLTTWIASVWIAGCALLALRASWVEYREGLPPSTGRAAVVLASLSLTAVLLTVHLQTFSPRAGDAAAQLVCGERDALDRQLRELGERHAEKASACSQLGASNIIERVLSDPITLAIINWVLALGAGAGLFFGNPATLIPTVLSRWRRGKVGRGGAQAIEQLERLAAAVDATDYDGGFAAAGEIREADLEGFDRRDFLFLRAYCVVQLAMQKKLKGKEHLERAIADLRVVLELTPRSAATRYLLGYALVWSQQFDEALGVFRASERELGSKSYPFASNQSVCLLHLAEQALIGGNVAEANAHLDETARLGVLAHNVPVVTIRARIVAVRNALASGKTAEAEAHLRAVREVSGLDVEQGRTAHLIADVMAVVVSYRQQRVETAELMRALIANVAPDNLPDVDEEAAEEFLAPAVPKEKLPFPHELYRILYFLHAVVLSQRSSTRGAPIDEGAARELATPLLRALQFEPRHREALLALGVLYAWFVPNERRRAFSWIRAALTMGSPSKLGRRVLERQREADLHERQLLARFGDLSTRYLSDPAVTKEVRRELLEELGRFTEFQPVIIEIERTLDSPSQSPTLQMLQQRAESIDGLIALALARGAAVEAQRLRGIKVEYTNLRAALSSSAARLAELEKHIMCEVAGFVFRDPSTRRLTKDVSS